MAVKIADALEVSLDYLVGKTEAELDNATFKRIQDITRLPQKEKEHVFVFLDAFLSKMKCRVYCNLVAVIYL